MKKTEFKKLVKPLIKECIREVIFEEGMLSGIISEVVQGLSHKPIIKENVQAAAVEDKEQVEVEYKQKLTETKKRMLDAIGEGSYNGIDLFENTQPLASGGSPDKSEGPSNPLAGVAPGDSGVDISSIFSTNSSRIWKQLKN